MTAQFSREVARGERFEFGKNWQSFLNTLDDERIAIAEASLRERLGDISGKTFLDVGSGSGLSSLAARRLGAKVRSFDYDPHSVACTEEMRRRYFPDDADWTVSAGNILDDDFVASLGRYDIVYAWGVLHHTGAMWRALENVATLVEGGGRLWLALYNDQGGMSRVWTRIKNLYVSLSPPLRPLLVGVVVTLVESYSFLVHLAMAHPGDWFRKFARKKFSRGMSYWHDWVDWVGGWPFEVSKPEQVFQFFKDRGLRLEWLYTCGGGNVNNEYILVAHTDCAHAGSEPAIASSRVAP